MEQVWITQHIKGLGTGGVLWVKKQQEWLRHPVVVVSFQAEQSTSCFTKSAAFQGLGGTLGTGVLSI